MNEVKRIFRLICSTWQYELKWRRSDLMYSILMVSSVLSQPLSSQTLLLTKLVGDGFLLNRHMLNLEVGMCRLNTLHYMESWKSNRKVLQACCRWYVPVVRPLLAGGVVHVPVALLGAGLHSSVCAGTKSQVTNFTLLGLSDLSSTVTLCIARRVVTCHLRWNCG